MELRNEENRVSPTSASPNGVWERGRNGAALTAGFGFGVICFSETLAPASGETYRLTASQSTVPQMDITDGEVVIERLG